MTDSWSSALNLVDDKIQEFRHAPFDHLRKRPYRSELADSNEDVCFTLFVDPVSESHIRVILQAQSSAPAGQSRVFAHGFDMHKDGSLGEIPADELWEYS